MRRFATAGIVAFVLSVAASAAVAQAPGTHDWSGFYAGVNIGGVELDANGEHRCVDPAGIAFGRFCDRVPNAGLSPAGFLGGVEAGHNWQQNSWVFGVAGDVQGASLHAASRVAGPFPLVGGGTDPADTTYTASERLRWLSTMRARAGYAAGTTLFYVTAGAAIGQVSVANNASSAISGTAYPTSNEAVLPGWTAGAGAEWAFAPHWSVKLEGLYFDLGSLASLGSAVPAGRTHYQEGYSFAISGWIGRAGVDFHF